MILFVRPKKNEVTISFQATTKPEIAARNLLVLSEVFDPSKIDIIESFIYNNKKEFLSGDAAYNLVAETLKQEGINEYLREYNLRKLLERNECFEC